MNKISKLIKDNKIVLYLSAFVLLLVAFTSIVLTVNARKKQAYHENNISENLVIVENVSTVNRDETSQELLLISSGISSEVFLSDVCEDNDEFSELSESQNSLSGDDSTTVLNNEDEYAKLAIADVTNYVNVRMEPNEQSEIVGYIYKGAVANIEDIAGEDNDWFKINSGNVNGYIKAQYFIAGDAAAEVAQDYVTKYATVICDRLNVRQEATTSSGRIGYIENGEKVKIVDSVVTNDGDWLIVEYTEGKTGFVSAEFVTQTEEFVYARTVEEDKAVKEAEAALLARQTEADNDKSDKKENLTKYIDTSITPADSFGSNAELRQAIVNYACQFVGGPYVSGGNSLTNGTDCSGFTMLVYKHFGYNLSRIPQGQLDGQGRKISYDEIQPGDLVFYSSKGVKATHAALYIGNGQVVHATNHRDGIKITSITWVGPVWGLKNVID